MLHHEVGNAPQGKNHPYWDFETMEGKSGWKALALGVVVRVL